MGLKTVPSLGYGLLHLSQAKLLSAIHHICDAFGNFFPIFVVGTHEGEKILGHSERWETQPVWRQNDRVFQPQPEETDKKALFNCL